jgi:hypothetical protein
MDLDEQKDLGSHGITPSVLKKFGLSCPGPADVFLESSDVFCAIWEESFIVPI